MKEARLRAGAGRAPSAAAARLVRRLLGSAGHRPLTLRAPGTSERGSRPSSRRGWWPRPALPRPGCGPTPWRGSPRRASFDSGWGDGVAGCVGPWAHAVGEGGKRGLPPAASGAGRLTRGPGAPRNQLLRGCAAKWGWREESSHRSLPACAVPPPRPPRRVVCFLHLPASPVMWAN